MSPIRRRYVSPMRDWQDRMIARWPYSGMNYQQARERIRCDLHARGFTDDDLDWLLGHGWDPVPYLCKRWP